MTKHLVARTHDERGMTTAEYALGTIAVIALIAAFVAYASGGAFNNEIARVFKEIVDWILTFVGTK
jgi:Flp pilus assembly pilin Flp